MMTYRPSTLIPIFCLGLLYLNLSDLATQQVDSINWEFYSVSGELDPSFSMEEVDQDSGANLTITTNHHKNLHGYWETTIPVKAGSYYLFSIQKTGETDIRYTPVDISWLNDEGGSVYRDKNYGRRYAAETFPAGDHFPWKARPEIPIHQDRIDEHSVKMSAVFQVPPNADMARIRLHLRYKPNAKVEWSQFYFENIPAPEKKKVKVATVFLPPTNHVKVSSGEEAIKIFEPYFAEAAGKGARLICLPEWLNKAFSKEVLTSLAEQIPGGTSTQYLEKKAAHHNLYIVAGLAEEEAGSIYNTAILVGPEGYIGKYRKTGITLAEANDYGVTPGADYPVFDTEIGRIGMMICYDLYFPEVAQKISESGADIIAMPIAGGNPVLAQARAIENQVYLITSTYSVRENWIKTAVFDVDGQMLDYTDRPGTMAIAEIEISDLPKYWAHLGHLKADLRIQKPIAK